MFDVFWGIAFDCILYFHLCPSFKGIGMASHPHPKAALAHGPIALVRQRRFRPFLAWSSMETMQSNQVKRTRQEWEKTGRPNIFK